jgi:hypothetical protein
VQQTGESIGLRSGLQQSKERNHCHYAFYRHADLP